MFNLTPEESKFEFDFEMATLDMNAGRFSDAETKLSNIGRQIKSSNAYLGIGLCKLSGLLYNETTLEETFYCLAKSIALSDAPESLAVICSEAVIAITKQFSEAIIIKSHEQQEAKAKEILSNLVLMGSIMTSPLIKKDTTAKWVSTAAGVGAFLNIAVQRNKHVSVKSNRNSLIINLYLLETFTQKLLAQFPAVLELFSSAFKEISDYTIEHSTTEEQKAKNLHKKQMKELTEVKNSLAPDSPYFTHLENAKSFFEQKQFELALQCTRDGLKIIPADDELNYIRDNSIMALSGKVLRKYVFAGIVIMFLVLITILSTVEHSSDGFNNALFASIAVFTIVYYFGRRAEKRRRNQLLNLF